MKLNIEKIKFFCFIILICLFSISIIHESGHIITCWLVGGNVLSVGYTDYFFMIYVVNQYPNMTARGIGALGGSLFNCLICLSLYLILKNKSKYSLGFILTIFCECSYWIISILSKHGDAWNFSQVFSINYLYILISSIILCIFAYFMFTKKLFRILEGMQVKINT